MKENCKKEGWRGRVKSPYIRFKIICDASQPLGTKGTLR